MTLELPPLRSYKDNLEMLANVFLEQAAQRTASAAPRIAPDGVARLQAYDFPGNVRELKNTHRARGDPVHAATSSCPADLPGSCAPATPAPAGAPGEPARSGRRCARCARPGSRRSSSST